MFFRLTYFNPSPGKNHETKTIFYNEVVPEVRKQKGNIGVHLLEPVNQSDDHISITQWKTKADADAYEASGKYKQLVSKISDKLSRQPVLKTYNVEESMAAVF
jgi:heme-degrading monooxygenase HmoA